MDALQYHYQFINFSTAASRNEREAITRYLYSVCNGKPAPLPHGNFFDKWHKALDTIVFALNGLPLRGIETLAVNEIIEFIEKTETETDSAENPFASEFALIEECSALNTAQFAEYADDIISYIQSEYMKHELDGEFYLERLIPGSEHQDEAVQDEAIMEAFTGRWKFLAMQKTLRWKKETINKQALEFSASLKQKILDNRNLERIFGISQDGGQKLFNRVKGKLQKVNINALEQSEHFYKKDMALRSLAEELGRGVKESEKEKPQRNMLLPMGEEFTGFTTGNRLDRLPASEAVLMIDGDLEPLFYKKFAYKELLNYETKPVYKEIPPDSPADRTRGPFILCIDTSGSMKGAPECAAKALVFALLKMAVKDGRKCYLIMFALDTEELEISDFERGLGALCDFLGNSFYGGTDASAALDKALSLLEGSEWNDADVVAVSDFIMPCFSSALTERIIRRRESGTRFFACVTGNSGGTPPNPAVTALFDRELVYRC
jgi:uncharacterized protein with von Willebrand factor type A (vWA) domain